MLPLFLRRSPCGRDLFVKFSTHHRLPVEISQRRSPRAIAVYSYIVVCVLRGGGSGGTKLSQAGFTLPFAVPAAVGRRSSGHERYFFPLLWLSNSY